MGTSRRNSKNNLFLENQTQSEYTTGDDMFAMDDVNDVDPPVRMDYVSMMDENGYVSMMDVTTATTVTTPTDSTSSGYSYGRNQENSPMLKLIFPNLLRIGRNNTRALDGPITMPKNPGELMDKIVGAYESFFEVWNTSLISETMKAPKWLVDLFESLLVGDMVYFKKIEDDVSSP